MHNPGVPWQQNYVPLGSVWLSALVASLPVVVLLGLLGLARVRAHLAALAALFGTSVGAREALRELLHGEPPARSDGELAVLLSAAGYQVARRTVTKYRREIGVAPCRQR